MRRPGVSTATTAAARRARRPERRRWLSPSVCVVSRRWRDVCEVATAVWRAGVVVVLEVEDGTFPTVPAVKSVETKILRCHRRGVMLDDARQADWRTFEIRLFGVDSNGLKMKTSATVARTTDNGPYPSRIHSASFPTLATSICAEGMKIFDGGVRWWARRRRSFLVVRGVPSRRAST